MTEDEQVKYEMCPICSCQIGLWRTKRIGRTEYHLSMCTVCGFCFVNPRPSALHLVDYYSTTGHGTHDLSTDPYVPEVNLHTVLEGEIADPNSSIDAKRIVETVNSLVSVGNSRRFLDIGCGFGFFSMEAQSVGFDVVSLEMASQERSITYQMTGITPLSCSFEEFESDSNTYSAVLMSQILEHASDINLWIAKAQRILEQGGVLAIALPNFNSVFRMLLMERDPYVCPPAHLNFFHSDNLSKLLEKHALKVEQIQWVSRLPQRTYHKYLHMMPRPIPLVASKLSSQMLKTLDRLHLGIMLNIYARKMG